MDCSRPCVDAALYYSVSNAVAERSSNYVHYTQIVMNLDGYDFHYRYSLLSSFLNPRTIKKTSDE